MMSGAMKKIQGLQGFMIQAGEEVRGEGPSSPGEELTVTIPAQALDDVQVFDDQASSVFVPHDGRYSNVSQQAVFGSPLQRHSQRHMEDEHLVPNSDSGRENIPPPHVPLGNGWEDSTVASVLDDSDYRSRNVKSKEHLRGQHDDPFKNARSPRLSGGFSREPRGPYITQEDGYLKWGPLETSLLPAVRRGPNTQSAGFHRATRELEAQETPKAKRGSGKPKSTLPEDRHARKQQSKPERPSRHQVEDIEDSQESAAPGVDIFGHDTEQYRHQGRLAGQFAVHRDDDADNLTAESLSGKGVAAHHVRGIDAAMDHTPRARRHLAERSLSSSPVPIRMKAANQEKPLLRTRSQQGPSSKKRRLSLDYDDAALSAMNYADLKNEDFDRDPALVPPQALSSTPAGGTLEDKLDYYKGKDEQTQGDFFAQMTRQNWEDSGDWLLEQFSGVMQKIREARKAKRALVNQFETEIANREEAVRGKIVGIERTLRDLRSEGSAMMRGKTVDI